jgi:LytS/YehU family sensor histidine kinase
MKGLESFIDYLFTSKRWIVHIFFWIVVFMLYGVFFGRQGSNYLQTFFFVGLLMPVTIATTYFLNYFLVPHFLLKDRYWFFFLYFIYTLVISIFLEVMIVVTTFLLLAEVNVKNMSPASIDIFFLLTSLLMIVFFGMAIKLLLHWRNSKESYQKLMRDKIEAELKFLKVQLNPHFLFNTLNNLYYLTTEKSEKAPLAILQLSELLDYVMHSGKWLFVPFDNEWKQVENYVALELLRYEDRVKISKSVTGRPEECKIAPMILITLIENAFKHGVMRVAGKSWINMVVDCHPEKICLLLSNSSKTINSGNGIGLNNLRGQLDLLYGDDYTLTIEANKPEEFSLNLTLIGKK